MKIHLGPLGPFQTFHQGKVSDLHGSSHVQLYPMKVCWATQKKQVLFVMGNECTINFIFPLKLYTVRGLLVVIFYYMLI